MLYFIYGLIDPRTDEVRYVGITNDPNVRLRGHLVGSTTNERKSRWVEELANTGLEPRMKIIEIVESRAKAEERESQWITHYTEQGVRLTNAQKNPLKGKERRPQRPNLFNSVPERVNEPVDLSGIYAGYLEAANEWRETLGTIESFIQSNDLETLSNWLEQEHPDIYEALKGQQVPIKGWKEEPTGESIILD